MTNRSFSFLSNAPLASVATAAFVAFGAFISSGYSTRVSSSEAPAAGTNLAIVTLTPTPTPTPTPPPNPSVPLWIDAKKANNIAYFAFAGASPRIERFDFASESWLPSIALSGAPTALAVDSSGIYVSFARRTSRLALNGSSETHLINTSADVSNLVLSGNHLYLSYPGGNYGYAQITSIEKLTALIRDSKSYFYAATGLSAAPSKSRIYGRTTGISPSDIVQTIANADGTLGNQTDSSYHGSYPNATRTFVFPDETKVADDSGIIYNSIDLTYVNSYAGTFKDLDFSGDRSVVLRDTTLIGYSNVFVETGRFTLAGTPRRIFVSDPSVFTFYQGDTRGVFAVKTPLAALVPGAPGQPINPTGLAYKPDSIQLGEDGIIYILSRANFSIFRWSVPQRQYLSTIPLIEAPTHITYSPRHHALYLGYPGGKMTKIQPQVSFSESAFTNLPQSPLGLAAADEFIFAVDASGAWDTHYVFRSDGVLLDSEEWSEYSTEYIWSSFNRKMYYFRDDSSPNDINSRDIYADGTLGTNKDSPYHTSSGIVHPIRVSPDGNFVLLGSGWLYDGMTLNHVSSLSNNIVDGDWRSSTLYTARFIADYTQVQAWGSNFALAGTKQLSGKPLRLIVVGNEVVLVSEVNSKPVFTVFDASLDGTFQPAAPTPTPTPRPLATPTPTATPWSPPPYFTPTPSPTMSPSPSASPTPPTSTPPPRRQVVNLASRLNVKTGDDVLIGGFIITGSTPKKVMIRASGPSLETLSNRLADTVLELHLKDGSVITNDNWRQNQESDIIATTIPPAHELESAIVATLEPGAYTGVVRGKDDMTGIGVVEAYDLDSGSPARLVNIAARGFVDKGDNAMFGGFYVGEGISGAKVLLRAIGPSLANAGVTGALQDPVLELYNADGVVVASNDNWRDTQQGEIDSSGLAPTDNRESVIITVLSGGGHTALIRGKDDTVGVGLLEIYSVQ